MAQITEDPPLRVPRIVPHSQHFDVMIGFKHKHIGIRNCRTHFVADITEICRHTQLLFAIIKVITHRLSRIMRDRE
ncbi:hypothetical protein D3C85_1658770 [compost metagenome]